MQRRDFLTMSAGLLAMPPIEQLYASVHQQMDKGTAETSFDVIVLGVGSMGSATCYHLAKRGVKVLGLEQFDIPHELGSHGGQSRIIRKAYFEHPDYVPLLQRAYQNWGELEEMTGSQVYYRTGLLYFGKPDHLLLRGVHESANKYHVRVDGLTNEAVRKQYPTFHLPDDYEKLIEPDAGFLTPERSILLYVEQALKHGALIHTKEHTLDWRKEGDGYVVRTDKRTYSCQKLVITAGAWASKLTPSLASKLTVTRQVSAWVQPKNWDAFALGKFPCWTVADDIQPGIYYGFPVLPVGKFGGPVGLKLAHHSSGSVVDPDTISRVPTAEDEVDFVRFLQKYLPDGYSAIHVIKTCMYTNTADGDFVLDFLPDFDKDVVVATGFSGHGFKFASVVGEIMADLAMTGKTGLPIGFLGIKRLL